MISQVDFQFFPVIKIVSRNNVIVLVDTSGDFALCSEVLLKYYILTYIFICVSILIIYQGISSFYFVLGFLPACGITLLIHCLLGLRHVSAPGCDVQLFKSNDGELRERSIGKGRIKPVLRFKKV